jgi:hypothetical protein
MTSTTDPAIRQADEGTRIERFSTHTWIRIMAGGALCDGCGLVSHQPEAARPVDGCLTLSERAAKALKDSPKLRRCVLAQWLRDAADQVSALEQENARLRSTAAYADSQRERADSLQQSLEHRTLTLGAAAARAEAAEAKLAALREKVDAVIAWANERRNAPDITTLGEVQHRLREITNSEAR